MALASRRRGALTLIAKSHIRKSLSQRRHFFRSVQLFEAPLRLKPKSGRFSVSATALFGEPDETASAVDRRWMDIDQAIALQEAKHLPHRGPLDIEPFGKSVHRDTSRFAKRR